MKILKILFFLLTIGQPFTSESGEMVIGCKQYGFFAEFLWAINHLHYAEHHHLTPIMYWDSRFAYFSPDGFNGSKNGWEYYFQPVSGMKYNPNYPIHREDFYSDFSCIWWYSDYINYIHLLTPDEQACIKAVPGKRALAGYSHYPRNYGHLYSSSLRH